MGVVKVDDELHGEQVEVMTLRADVS